jgi:hypothetical protein
MPMLKLIAQVALVLAVAGASAVLAQVWRNEAVSYQYDRERDANIQRQRLISEGEKAKNETIAEYEADGERMRGFILGRAEADARVIEEAGETDRVAKMNESTRSQAFALDAINGILSASRRFTDRATKADGQEANAFRTIGLYLDRTAKNQDGSNSATVPITFRGETCAASLEKASSLAKELMTKATGSPRDLQQLFNRRY